jgi:hypothetical protein
MVKKSGGTFRKLGLVFIEEAIHSIRKRPQVFIVILFPVSREKMIIKDVHDDRGIFVEEGAKSNLGLENDGVGIGVLINFPMQKNSLLNGAWIVEKTVSSNPISNEISNDEVWILSGKVQVGQIVHPIRIGSVSPPGKERIQF